MKHKTLTKWLAMCGTALVAFPILAMILTGVVGSIVRGRLMVDYLMPAELLPAVLVGGGLLVAATWLTHHKRVLIGGTLGGGLVVLAAGLLLASVSGLADGSMAAEGPVFILVNAAVLSYAAAVATLAVEGALLVRGLVRSP
jgi:hypothetical protein